MLVSPTPPRRFKFVKRQRLLNSQDYDNVFNSASFKVHQPNILLFVKTMQPDASGERLVSRLGLAITKKKIKYANQRNRVKRLAREYFRLHQHELSYVVDIAVIIKHFPVGLTNADLTAQYESAFRQINAKLKAIMLNP